MKVINSNEFDATIKDGTILVDFYADWCMPCRQLAPVLEELSEQYTGKVDFVKVDIEESRDIAERFGIMSIPTVIIFKNGEVAKQMAGFQPKQMFAQNIDEVLLKI